MWISGIKKSSIWTNWCDQALVLTVPPVFHRLTNREAVWGLGHDGDDKEDMVEKLEVALGHPVSLACESNAIPPPKLSWYKDGQKLTSGDGVVLLPGKMKLLPLWPRFIIMEKMGLSFQVDRSYKSLECKKKMVESIHAKLLMKLERTTCTLTWRS